jgi:DNA-binding LacI/PurR family transcriptional regulator
MTTKNRPFYEMGKKASEMLIEMIGKETKNSIAKTVTLKAELIFRGSTK